MIRVRFTIAAMLLPMLAAAGVPLTIVKSSVVADDKVNTLNPKALPGALVDYSILVTNPGSILGGGNNGLPVTGEQFTDPVPANMCLVVTNYPGASAPVELADGAAAAVGVLIASGLTLPYISLSSLTDGIEFYDGTTWNYVPVPDANGCDARVKQIRMKMTGTHTTGGTFRLRFRTRVN
jgi:hypothetical protein